MPVHTSRRRRRLVGGTGGPDAYAPLSISGLVAWYDFSDPLTLFEDAARTDPAEPDDVVLGVSDKSGNGYHASVAVNGPAFKTSVRNGRSALLFDGTNDSLSATSPDFNDACTWFWIGAQDDIAADNRYAFEVTNGSNHSGIAFRHSEATTGKASFIARDATTVRWTPGTTDQTDGVWRLFASVLDDTVATEMKTWQNGGAADSTTATYDGPNPNTLNALSIGSAVTGTQFFQGYMGELLIYNAALSLANINTIASSIAYKWGVTWTTAV